MCFVCIKPHIWHKLKKKSDIIFFPFLLPLSSIGLVFLSAEMVCFNQRLPIQGIAPGRWIVVYIGDYKSCCHSQTVVNLSAYTETTLYNNI